MSEDDKQVKTQVFTLGEIILKLEMPNHFVEAVNKAIDERVIVHPIIMLNLQEKLRKRNYLILF